ncbi:hypothetical protein ACF0H5_015304 [Mactra antiquata]
MENLFPAVLVMMTVGSPLHVSCNDIDYNIRNLTCTTDVPYTRCNVITKQCACVQTCDEQEVLDGTKCILVSDCTKLIVFDGQCLDMCPRGYVYVYHDYYRDVMESHIEIKHTMADLDIQVCVTYRSLQYQAAGLVVGMVVYIAIMIAFFSFKSFSLSSMKNMFLSLGQSCRKRKKTNTDGDDDDDDDDDNEQDLGVALNCNVIVDDDDENCLL